MINPMSSTCRTEAISFAAPPPDALRHYLINKSS